MSKRLTKQQQIDNLNESYAILRKQLDESQDKYYALKSKLIAISGYDKVEKTILERFKEVQMKRDEKAVKLSPEMTFTFTIKYDDGIGEWLIVGESLTGWDV